MPTVTHNTAADGSFSTAGASAWNANHTVSLGTDENFVTAAELVVIQHTSGTNTGDQVGDGTTITGTGHPGNPFVSVGGGGGITALTGDVTASGTGSVAASVAYVNTSTAANVHAAELLANAATNANTASTIVKRDASGNFSAGTITASLTGNASGTAGGLSGTSLSGDVSNSGNAITLDTVNSNVGSFTNANITVNGKGLITAASNGSGGSGGAANYGEMQITANSTSTSMTNQNQWYQVTTGWAAGNLNNFTYASSALTATVAGTYAVVISISYLSSTSTDAMRFSLFQNGSLSSVPLAVNTTPSGSYSVISISGIVVAATNDVFALYAENIVEGGTSITVKYCDFSMFSLPGAVMTWPSSAGIAVYSGSSSWGASIAPATGIATWLATPSSANLAASITDETGSGSLVFAMSPTLVTPILGTPASGTLTNCSGYPVATSSTFGTIKPDNSTITISGGVLTAIGAGILYTSALGTSDALTATFTPAPTLADGLVIVLTLGSANTTTTPTLNVNGTGPLLIVKNNQETLVPGDLSGTAGQAILMYFWNGSAGTWNLMNPAVSHSTTGLITSSGRVYVGGSAAPTTGQVLTATGASTATWQNSGGVGYPSGSGIVTVSSGSSWGTSIVPATGIATFLTTPSSANLAAATTDETGSGALVFATSPTLVTPILGTPTSGTLTNCTFPVAVGSTGITMDSNKLLGRYSASVGAIQEITISTGLALDGSGNLTATTSSMVWPGSAGIAVYSGASSWSTSKSSPTGNIVGTSDAQTLTYKDVSSATNTFPAGFVQYYTQSVTSQTSVTVTHNLGRKPIVQVLDSSGYVYGAANVQHTSVNAFIATWSSSFSGSLVYVG